MKKTCSRLLAMLLAVLMVFTAVPVAAAAEAVTITPIKNIEKVEGTYYTVKGVISFINASNNKEIYLQDETGGICVFLSAAADSIKRGDTITVTGKYKDYNNLPELEAATLLEKDTSLKLSPLTRTIKEITTDDICEYVKITDAEVTSISSDYIGLKDSTGTIQIYKALATPESLSVGDIVTVTASVGTYKTTLQLRTMLAEDIVITKPVTPPEPVAPSTGYAWEKVVEAPADGDWSGTYLIVCEDGATGYIYKGVDTAMNYVEATITNSTLVSDGAYAVTIEQADDGYLIRVPSGDYMYVKESDKNYINIDSTDTAKENPVKFSMQDGSLTITGSTKHTFLFYKSGANSRFRFYENSSQKLPVSLYKLSSTFVIWNPQSGMALSSESDGTNLKAVSVTKDGEKLAGYGNTEIWTVEKLDNEKYTISYNGKKIGTSETTDSIIWEPDSKNTEWTLESVGEGKDGTYYIRNDTKIIGYSGSNTFDTSGKDFVSDKERYEMVLYPAVPQFEQDEPKPEEPTKDSGYAPKDGDKVTIFNPGNGKVIALATTGSLTAKSASASGGKLFTDDAPLFFTVKVSGEGDAAVYTFTSPDGKVLNSSLDGKTLSLAEPGTDKETASKWKLVQISGGYQILNIEAHDGDYYNKSIEYYSNKFQMYGFKKDDAAFIMQFFTEDMLGTRLTTDPDIEDTIAQWGGGGPYSEAQDAKVQGDLYKTGDMLDETAVFTVRAAGANAKPYQRTEGSGSTPENPNYNYYMGGEKIGASTGDYMQFALSTKGYGAMTLSFRMRVTGAGAKDYTVQYSVDGGTTFVTFGEGKYSYKYHNYNNNTDVSGSGNVSDGKVSIAVAGQYISYELIVPDGAENANNLLIRFVPGSSKVSGATGAIEGNVRIDSVKLIGSPITDASLPGYVMANPDGQDADVPAGTDIALTPSQADATVSYRFVKMDGTVQQDWTVGTTAKLPASLPIALEVKAVKGSAEGPVRRLLYQAGTVEAVKMNPNGGGIIFAGDATTATITLSTATEGAAIWYRTSAMTPEAEDESVNFVEYKAPIEVKKGFGSLTVEAYATKAGLADSSITSRDFTEREKERYDLYFGQMHSHTGYSDGTEDPEAAYKHADELGEEWNMDFLAVTDHSNSLDNAGGDRSINDPVDGEWTKSHEFAEAASNLNFVAIAGYEMTWSNGLGHINTFNTAGFQDRTQSAYTTYSTALQNYYAELKNAPASISQFNHPGTTFGDFSDFSYYDPEIDQLITLIEVGNGEGAIGSSGYFPSYEYYTRALDKGWHLAPTNNQDNHKGKWGDANNGRDVVLVDELTEDAIYDAMRNYRVYATEDLNLEIYYTFDGQLMGSILSPSDVGKEAEIKVELNDPDLGDRTSAKVEVIVNGGKVAAETTSNLNGDTVTLKVPTTYNYYYIKITQGDGDIAVTAPVWVGEVEAIGVSSFSTQESLTVAGQAQIFDLSLFNNEKMNLDVTGITITLKDNSIKDDPGKVVATLKDITRVKKMGTAETSFQYAFANDGLFTLTATVNGLLDGVAKSYTQDLEVTVMPADLVTTILVDGTHYNDYVTGYYGANMGNMTAIAANSAVQVKIVPPGETITEGMLANCKLLVLSAPAKKDGTANAGDFAPSFWEEDFIAKVKKYVENGGSVIVTGLADYQDKGAPDASYHSAAQQNKLLEAIGSSMRINDDEVCDDKHNGGQNYRLYPEIFNMDDPIAAPWLKGMITASDVAEGENYQTYSQYSGCSVDPGKGTWLVNGFDSTYSIDSDGDKIGGIALGESTVTFLAYEKVGAGHVFAAGGVFLSDFEVKAELDNIWDLPYANRTIFENIMHNLCLTSEVSTIAETRRAPMGKIFAIEGYVTSGTEFEGTTFFDAIYVQDETGGTTCFPYSTTGLAIGTKVRILGYTDAYQDDREIQIINLTVLGDEPHIYEPKVLTNEQAADYSTYGGQYVQTTGTVSGLIRVGSKVSQFNLTDETGVPTTIFIDGYIWTPNGTDPISASIRNGAVVTAAGLSYMHPEGDAASVCVLRVRNLEDITIVSLPPVVTPTVPSTPEPAPAPDVTTSDVTENEESVTQTVAAPSVTVEDGKASYTVTEGLAEEMVKQAETNKSEVVVIAPQVTGSGAESVTEASVTVPAAVLGDLGEKTEASLRVETPVGSVTLPNDALTALAEEEDVTVALTKSEDSVTISITAGETSIDSIPGSLKAVLPLEDGQVAVLVDEEGNETILPKSLVKDGSTYVVLDGPGTIKVVDNSKHFEDVDAGEWYGDAVNFSAVHELFSGTSPTTFEPDTEMSRAMMATVLWKLESMAGVDSTVSSAAIFPDVTEGAWYDDSILWASTNNIIGGTGDGTFEPDRSITRQEMVVMVYNYAKAFGLNTTKTTELTAFPDGDDVDSWALEAVQWAVANGILNGNENGELKPTDTSTRAEVAAFFTNLIQLIVE